MEDTFSALGLIEQKLKHDYIYLLVALADMIIGLGLSDLENIIALKLGVFMFFTGFVFAVLILLQINDAATHYNRWHDAILSAYRAQKGLPLLPHESKNIPLEAEPAQSLPSQSHTVYLDQPKEDGQHATDVRRFDEKNKPPQEFIIQCHALAVGKDKWHVPERSVIEWLKEHKDWDRWNVWLDTMEEVGILKLEDNRPHAARYWDIEHIQLKQALEIFEYPPTELGVSSQVP